MAIVFVSLYRSAPDDTSGCHNAPAVTGRPANLGSCWHGPCKVLRVLDNKRLVLENGRGYIRVADPEEVFVN